MNFQEYWKQNQYQTPRFEKSRKLSREELTKARELIKTYQSKGLIASKAIKKLAKDLNIADSHASMVYWTEIKRSDVVATRRLGRDIGFTKYKVILSPDACKVCKQKTNEGRKIFSQADVQKSGYGQMVPFHPHCYCIVIPAE